MEKEKKELTESRAKLGIPGKDEESVSIKSYKEKINSLTARKKIWKKARALPIKPSRAKKIKEKKKK